MIFVKAQSILKGMGSMRLIFKTTAAKSFGEEKGRCVAVVICILSVFVTSCQEQEQPAPVDTCLTILLGDKDGFGIGLSEEDTWVLPAGTPLPIDYRDAGDPRFTDTYPADMGTSEQPSHEVLFTYTFAKPSKGIISAKLKLMTLGMQDDDSQVTGSDTDIGLYLDDIEVYGAFDHIDQFDLINGSWSELASDFEVEIPPGLLPVLIDGKVNVRIEILQLNPNMQSYDAFAIDYCELEVCFGDQVR